jgi:dipeptidase E
MKFYLSSQHVGSGDTYLYNMLGKNKRAAIVANAIDGMDAKLRKERVLKEQKMLQAIGITSDELDLRKFFGKASELREAIVKYDMIWVRGGNVFTLRKAMVQSGFDQAVLPSILRDELVYAGYSAGVIVTAPDLYGSHLVDDPFESPDGYDASLDTTSGLSMVDFYFATHCSSTEPWAAAVQDYIRFMQREGRKVVLLEDGDVYIEPGGGSESFIIREKEMLYV